MLYIYLGIILCLLVLIVWNMMTEKNLMVKIDAALVIVTLVLRLLLIK